MTNKTPFCQVLRWLQKSVLCPIKRSVYTNGLTDLTDLECTFLLELLFNRLSQLINTVLENVHDGLGRLLAFLEIKRVLVNRMVERLRLPSRVRRPLTLRSTLADLVRSRSLPCSAEFARAFVIGEIVLSIKRRAAPRACPERRVLVAYVASQAVISRERTLAHRAFIHLCVCSQHGQAC